MNNNVSFWFLASLFFLLLEMGSPGLFYFLSFFFGSLAAGVVSFVYDSWMVQGALFFAVSAFSFLILKTWVKKHSRHARKTNVQALVGKRGTVTKIIAPPQPVQVQVGGETWSARSTLGIIKEGAVVEVLSTTGAYLVVSEIKNS